MAYNYFPTNYQPMYYQPQSAQTQNNGIQWVQGLEGAKAYAVGAGQSVLLMDSEESVFYIKSADSVGMPSLREFEYTERNAQESHPQTDMSKYVTKEELDKRLSEFMRRKEKKDA